MGTPSKERVPTGALFRYTLFTTIYRCPGFERTPIDSPTNHGSVKTQNVFNYSRTMLGRKFLSKYLGDAEAGDDWAWPGAIMKVSAVYSPADMYMMLDEQWDFHCAGDYGYGGPLDICRGYWTCAETIHGVIGDMIGSYHGTKRKRLNYPELRDGMSGSIGHYDGHVSLVQDPCPWRGITGGGDLSSLAGKLVPDGTAPILLDPPMSNLYAQRGVPFSLDQIIAWLIGG